jgi:hypothetical protein
MGLAFSKFEKINGSEVSQKIQTFFCLDVIDMILITSFTTSFQTASGLRI